MSELLRQSPHEGDLVLVGVLPQPRDLEIARLLGWYRIPLRFAPKIVSVDWVAFYQTAAFGQVHQWCIEYIAPLKGVELVRRRELLRDEADHPRAEEEYYKLQIGGVQALAQPIPAGRWKRITFLYTTGELMMKARTINDLVVRSEERVVLWRSLREKALKGNLYQPEELPEFDLDERTLAWLGELKYFAEHNQPWEGLVNDAEKLSHKDG
jgi:hypothetical protein